MRRPPGYTPTYTLFPYTTLCRSRPELRPRPLVMPVATGVAAPHTGRASASIACAPVAGFAAQLLDQADFADHHALVERLGHVVNCEECNGSSCQGFHFNAGSAVKRCRRGNVNPVFRSEEHTSELQSLMRISYAVFCLTKKKSQ